jgi:hypothetical protein
MILSLLSLASSAQSKQELENVTSLLEKIYVSDQQYRGGWDSTIHKYGMNSPEFIALLNKTNSGDSLNIIAVGKVLDKYGWLSAEETSETANDALFLVIQHAPLKQQLKYLPLMKKAVEEHKAKSAELALLIDRTNMYQGKFQLYGSQLNYDAKGNLHVYPIYDEPNLNIRRKTMGLQPMEEYVKLIDPAFEYKIPVKDEYNMRAVIWGSVVDSKTNEAVPDVSIFSRNGIYITKTDSTGYFMIRTGRNTSIKVLAFRKKGYESYEFINTDFTKEVIQVNPELVKK